ncbi:hypothetical protein [Dokdonella sp.]|uniref:hypothetical protein n=1 Tax=Dokdonella sp. TaxID=2291710 RepID=UPI0031C071DB|nr:hypothetical protein [Dokdonella sp.]
MSQPRIRACTPLRTLPAGLAIACALALGVSPVLAHGNGEHTGGLHSKPDKEVRAGFDIVHTRIQLQGNTAIFHMAVSGAAGISKPSPIGKLAGSRVFSYVWPTTLDPYLVGFERKSGILALAVTAHPDFDDTPLFDENGDGDPGNDGDLWHTHWVVLQPDAACGKDALKVVDIPKGETPRLPRTWPGLPILIDSPGWDPLFRSDTLEVRVPFDDIRPLREAGFDGVTAALRVNADVHSPLLCVTDVFKVASGDLSLPGRTERPDVP